MYLIYENQGFIILHFKEIRATMRYYTLKGNIYYQSYFYRSQSGNSRDDVVLLI